MAAADSLRAIAGTPDSAIALVPAALALARWTDAALDPAPYLRHARALRDEVRAYVGGDAGAAPLLAEAARQVLAQRYGYGGGADPAEQGALANLARVIDRRRGCAVALSLLYVHSLENLGAAVELLAFPARVLVRLEDAAGRRLVLDPFDGGRIADARRLRALYREHRGGEGDLDPFHLAALSRRDALVYLQDQIKAHHLRNAAPEAALAALEAALLIAPGNARLWREAGLLHARLEHIGEAISALRRFLDLPGDDAQRYTASQLLQQLMNREGKGHT